MKSEIKITDTQAVSEVRLIYRTRVNPKDRVKIASSRDAYQLFFDSWNKNTIEYVEEFKIMLLNRANRVLGIANISKGTTTGSIVDIKYILQYAIKANACGIIVSHNHPGGTCHPSNADIMITQKIKAAANLLEVALLDHIIISPCEGYYSFADEGRL